MVVVEVVLLVADKIACRCQLDQPPPRMWPWSHCDHCSGTIAILVADIAAAAAGDDDDQCSSSKNDCLCS